ncbi:MAG TPA: N-acetylmuramoyl-L-alanine amidase [Thermoanaerobacterales bacterium]|nr:N-acetylmuramoyl-L-alanine amidase [Thermoanaerobacterales bacterium]
MKPGVTNVFVTTSDCSTLVVESISPLGYTINKASRYKFELIADSKLIMAPDTIRVFDGLINKIMVTNKGNKVLISVDIEYPASYQIKLQRGIPERLEVSFERSFIKNAIKDKVIVIDPGHGGKDRGKRGYINLLEKNVVLDIAAYLKQHLNFYGAHAIMTREKDVSMNLTDRIQTVALMEADMFIGIHTNWDSDKNVYGAKGTYQGEKSKILCDTIIGELGKKLRLKNLGIADDCVLTGISQSQYIQQIPNVNIEVCTISNPVEEGWLRSPVFKERVAAAIMNGIIKYIMDGIYTMV